MRRPTGQETVTTRPLASSPKPTIRALPCSDRAQRIFVTIQRKEGLLAEQSVKTRRSISHQRPSVRFFESLRYILLLYRRSSRHRRTGKFRKLSVELSTFFYLARLVILMLGLQALCSGFRNPQDLGRSFVGRSNLGFAG